MARNIEYWNNFILTEKEKQTSMSGLDSTSKVAVWRLVIYIVSVAIWMLDNLFDLHKSEIDAEIAKEKASSLQWYREIALRFQYGQNLIPDSDQYDNAGLTEQQIEEKKIVKQAAVTAVSGRLRIKVVTTSNGEYEQLDADQKNAFREYMNRVKDGGERITVESLPPDELKLLVDIWYNPLVLRADGSRIDGTNQTPVANAIRDYLKTLPFNGEYATTRLLDALQNVDGVSLVTVKSAQAQYGLFPFVTIDERYIPDAGYLNLSDANLTINYKEYVQG